MKRNKKTEKFKAYLRKEAEMGDNWLAQRALGYKPLDKPIHDGYDGEWELRSDIARSKDGEDLEDLIYHFGKKVWCRGSSFVRFDRHQRIDVNIKPYFSMIDENYYNNLQPWCKRFFSHSPADDRAMWSGVMKYYRVQLPAYYFKLKVTKSYKTHYKVIDEVLLQEEAEIEAEIDTKFFKEKSKSWSRRPSKGMRQIFNRADRNYNKRAVKKNLKMELDDYDDFVELRYNHKHSCIWHCW